MPKKKSSAATKPPADEPQGRSVSAAAALVALRRLQQLSVIRGLDALTDEEINAEIEAVRARRRRTR
jgi:hypothetical protein